MPGLQIVAPFQLVVESLKKGVSEIETTDYFQTYPTCCAPSRSSTPTMSTQCDKPLRTSDSADLNIKPSIWLLVSSSGLALNSSCSFIRQKGSEKSLVNWIVSSAAARPGKPLEGRLSY